MYKSQADEEEQQLAALNLPKVMMQPLQNKSDEQCCTKLQISEGLCASHTALQCFSSTNMLKSSWSGRAQHVCSV